MGPAPRQTLALAHRPGLTLSEATTTACTQIRSRKHARQGCYTRKMSSISARAALTNFIATLQHGSLPLELTGKGPFLYFFYLLRQLHRKEWHGSLSCSFPGPGSCQRRQAAAFCEVADETNESPSPSAESLRTCTRKIGRRGPHMQRSWIRTSGAHMTLQHEYGPVLSPKLVHTGYAVCQQPHFQPECSESAKTSEYASEMRMCSRL